MSTDEPREEELGPVFFVDRALGRRVAEILRAAGEQVEIHDDHFPAAAQDIDWIPHVARHGWVVLTKDKRLRYNKLERTAIQLAGLRVFTLASGNRTSQEMGELFVDARASMKRLVRDRPAPFIGKVYRGGRAEVWLDHDALAESVRWGR